MTLIADAYRGRLIADGFADARRWRSSLTLIADGLSRTLIADGSMNDPGDSQQKSKRARRRKQRAKHRTVRFDKRCYLYVKFESRNTHHPPQMKKGNSKSTRRITQTDVCQYCGVSFQGVPARVDLAMRLHGQSMHSRVDAKLPLAIVQDIANARRRMVELPEKTIISKQETENVFNAVGAAANARRQTTRG